MNVLVTGGAGFIGSHLVPFLRKRMKVSVYDLKHYGNIFDEGIYDEIDWADVVVHLAAHTSVKQSFQNPQEVYRNNVLGATRVLEICLEYKKRMLFPSTLAVHDDNLSPYANSKALAEGILRKFDNVTVLRFGNVYGPGMNQNSGALMYWCLRNLDGVMNIDGDGKQERDFIHVNDIVRIIERAIEKDWSGKLVECGTGVSHSVNEVVGEFAKYGRMKIQYNGSFSGQRKIRANTEILKNLYKQPLLSNFAEDIREIVELYQRDLLPVQGEIVK